MPTEHEIQERFEELPADVQHAIQSTDMAAALTAFGGAHNLHVDQMGALEDEALLVMLGFTSPAAFPARLRAALNVSEADAAAIAGEISERLFMPIRDSMRTYIEARLKKQAAGEKNAPPPSQPPAVRTPPPVPALPSKPAAQVAAPAEPEREALSTPAGGKTIMPSTVLPTVHPADQALAAAKITLPATQTITISDKKNYSVDPYREPVE